MATAGTVGRTGRDAANDRKRSESASYFQDRLEIAPRVQVVGGIRFDRFALTYHNNRNRDTLGRADNLVSPRAALVYKPVPPVSLYGSYTVSYLPSSGDQFSSLTTVTEQVKPEKFGNYEVGAKWEPHPGLVVTTAAYRLDRTNTRATEPNDPTRIVQTGRQRTNGFEVGLTGRFSSAWLVGGGSAYQDAFVTSATTAARAGAQVAQVPHHTLSLWNNYQFLPRLGAAVGVLFRTAMFAAIDNTVTVPGYTRVDLAAFYTLSRHFPLHATPQNPFARNHSTTPHTNTNISPWFRRTLRVALTAAF